MNIQCSQRKSTDWRKSKVPLDLFDSLLLIYFCTLHADQLGFSIGNYHIRVNNLVTLVLIVCLLIKFRFQILPIDKHFFLSMTFITLSVFLSFALSSYKNRCAVFMFWYGFTLLGYLLAPYILMRIGDAHKLFSLYITSFVVVGSYAFLQMILPCLHVKDPYAKQMLTDTFVRPNALAYEPSFYALYMTPFIMMCNFHYLFSPQENFYSLKKLTFIKIIFLNVLFIISASAGIIFAYGFFFIFIQFFVKKNNGVKKRIFKFMASFCITLFTFLSLAPFLITNFFMKFFFFGFISHGSFFHRWAGIKNAWTVFCENRLFGVGLGGYPAYLFDAFLRSHGQYIFFEKELANQEVKGNYLKLFEPTNVFTEILASLGVVGVLAFVYLIFIVCKKAFGSFKNNLNINLIISLFVMIIVLQFNQGILRTYVWVHLAMVCGFLDSKDALSPNTYTACVQDLS